MRFVNKSFAIPDEEAEFVWQRNYTEEMLEHRREMHERARQQEEKVTQTCNLAG